MSKPYLSFIIPIRNEADSIEILYDEIINVVQLLDKPVEFIFVDDGSTDHSYDILKKLHAQDSRVSVLKLRGNFGKSIALQVGFNQAKADIIFTLDGDLQDNPQEIPAFLEKLNEGYDLVSGWKKTRHDPWTKVLPSRIINSIARLLTGVKIHDTNCGFKVYRREVIENLNLYGELYRFIPIFAAKENFQVGEIPVAHRARRFGKTKFGIGRGIKGILDLITVVFLTGYLRSPGHFFGTLGMFSFFMGFVIGTYITYLRLTTGSIQNRHPLLFFGMLLMIIGVQLISTGLLAEMIIKGKGKPDYSYTIKEAL